MVIGALRLCFCGETIVRITIVLRLKKDDGLTLIEVALILVIASLILVPAVKQYDSYRASRVINDTRGNFSNITTAINKFVEENGFYPVPAQLTAAPDDADFGTAVTDEILAGTVPDCPDMALGACRFTSGVDGDQTLIGAVPSEVLKVAPENSLDGWKNKIIYAISETQTNPLKYTRSGAGVVRFTAKNSNDGTDLVELTAVGATKAYTNFDMALVSTGEAGKGGYTLEGNLIEACIGGTAEYEDENCNFDDLFAIDQNKREDPGTWDKDDNGTRSLVSGANYYDDLTFEQKSVPLKDWNDNDDTNTNHIVSSSNRISIGTDLPSATLEVVGDIAVNGSIKADSICSTLSGGDCFSPSLIGGSEAAMNCNRNSISGAEPVMGIGMNKVLCVSPTDMAATAIDGGQFQFPDSKIAHLNCGEGKLMTGINSSGEPICVTPP